MLASKGFAEKPQKQCSVLLAVFNNVKSDSLWRKSHLQGWGIESRSWPCVFACSPHGDLGFLQGLPFLPQSKDDTQVNGWF